jgi:hypothetical protein
MPDWLTGIFTREVSIKTALPLFIASFILLFTPANILEMMGMTEIRSNYASTIGIALLFSGSLLLSQGILALHLFARPKVEDHFKLKKLQKNLIDLTNDEKVVLVRFITDGEAKVSMRVNDGVAALLEKKYIISRASSLATRFENFDYIMQPWARSYLQKNNHLIK